METGTTRPPFIGKVGLNITVLICQSKRLWRKRIAVKSVQKIIGWNGNYDDLWRKAEDYFDNNFDLERHGSEVVQY